MKHWTRSETVLMAAFGLALGCGVAGLRGVSDTLLILLAAAATHAVIGHHWGVKLARRWAVIVLLVVTAALWSNVQTTQPFGRVFYTDRLSPRLPGGGVPLALPFWWYAVVSNLLLAVRAFFPWASVRVEAIAVAVGVVAIDFLTEPYWMWTRGAWFWSTNQVPLPAYLSWAVIAYLLTRLVAPTSGMRWEREWRPVALLAGLLAFTALRRWIG